MSVKYVGTADDFQSLLLKKESVEGDVAICRDTQKTYQYTKGEWKEFTPKVKGQGLSMSLYELNKSIMDQMPALTPEQLSKYKIEINQFIRDTQNTYYMLLCNESHYYTIFAAASILENVQKIGNIIIDLFAENDEAIIAIDKEADHYEIWAKNAIDTKVYMLFPYDKGVIKYAR